MFLWTLKNTAILVVVVLCGALAADYLVNVVLLPGIDAFSPATTLAVALFVAVPVCWYVTRQRLTLQMLKDSLARSRDAAEAGSEAKSVFLATMSHEIRTPLNGVLGMAQAMGKDGLSAVQRDRLSVIQQSGEALLAILNDILDLSKIEAGKLELEEIDFDLGDVARGAHQAFTALANKKGLSFGLDIEAARGVYRGDPVRLRQILYNLISNAVKFTRTGEIRVTGRFADAVLMFEVRDTGIGIAPEGLAKLFGAFYQVDASTTREFGGTGLGLSICRQLAEMMGGRINVESEVGQGSRFTVILPLSRTGPERSTPATGSVEAEAAEINLRVLAAEDNQINQLVLKTLLHQIGVEPVMVEDGQAAIDAWRSGAWDLILMDIQMPRVDGLAAARAIRDLERESGRPRTPILALTANAMPHQLATYLAGGMDGHIAKPIQARRLFEALQAVLDAEGGLSAVA